MDFSISELLELEVVSSDFGRMSNGFVHFDVLAVVGESWEVYITGDRKDGYAISSEEHSEDDVAKTLGYSGTIAKLADAKKLAAQFGTDIRHTWIENNLVSR